MTREIYVAGVDRAYHVRFPNDLGVVESADGTVEVGQLIIDDPDGTYDGLPLNPAYIVETAAAPTRLWTGFIQNQTESRGPYRDGPSRIITCETVDQNHLLVVRPVLSKTGFRPAETDLDRVSWLLGVDACSGLVYSGSLTNLTDNPINVDAADYRGQRPADILADFAAVAGKRFFVFYNPSTDKMELFYDLADAAVNDASASITNRLNLLAAGIYPPYVDAEFERSGEQLFSDAEVIYKGTGRVVAHNATTRTTYGEMWDIYSTDRIGKLATAQAAADQIVATHNKPDDTLRCTLQLPRANVNDIVAGQRVQVQFSHFSGMQSAWVYMRVTKREVHMHETGDYLVSLELTNKVTLKPGGFGRGGGNFPPPVANPTVVQYKHQALAGGGTNSITLTQAPAEGDVLVLWVTRRGGVPSLYSAFTASPDSSISPGSDGGIMGYRTVGAGESATIQVRASGDNGLTESFTVIEISGVATTPDAHSFADVDTSTPPDFVNAGTVTPTAGTSGLLIEGLCVHTSGYPSDVHSSITPSAGWSEVADKEDGNAETSPETGTSSHPLHWMGYRSITDASGSYSTSQDLSPSTYNFGGWGGETLYFASSSEDARPVPGTPMPWAVVSVTPGSTTSTGTTAFPYAATTLEVMVDGVTINHASYVETDPTTGDFTLSWVVDADNVVQVRYISA